MRLFGEDAIVIPITIEGVPRPAASMTGMSRSRPRGVLYAHGVVQREENVVPPQFRPVAPIPMTPPGVGGGRPVPREQDVADDLFDARRRLRT